MPVPIRSPHPPVRYSKATLDALVRYPRSDGEPALVSGLVAPKPPNLLFLLVSPCEWHFPFPYWVEALHQQMNPGPTDAAAAETLALADALSQICAGFLRPVL